MSGAPTAAAEGELTLLVGASREDIDAARPILDGISTSHLHFGEIGTGTAFKLINNLYGAVQIAGLAEAVALAHRTGLDRKTLIAAIDSGPCASPHFKRLVAGMAEGRIAEMPGLSIGLREKDARYSLAMAQDFDIGMAMSTVARAWYATAKPDLVADDDSALVATVVARGGRPPECVCSPSAPKGCARRRHLTSPCFRRSGCGHWRQRSAPSRHLSWRTRLEGTRTAIEAQREPVESPHIAAVNKVWLICKFVAGYGPKRPTLTFGFRIASVTDGLQSSSPALSAFSSIE